MAETIEIEEEYIELCQLVKFAGLSGSGGEVKQAIVNGLVKVNGSVETRKRKKIFSGDSVEYNGETLTVKKC
jgi:ribosome-associated protein